MKTEEVIKTSRLEKLEKKLGVIEKSKNYLETELSKIKAQEAELKEKTRKEKQALSLMNKAKRLRKSKE
jgi:hypothetical protein